MPSFLKRPLSPLAIELKKQRALRTLGMGPINSFAKVDVTTYYNAKIKSAHPDSEKYLPDDSGVTIQEFREAKDFLFNWLERTGLDV